MLRLLLLFALASLFHPSSTELLLCETTNEIPIHNNVPPMTTTSPYSILTSVSTAYQNETVTLRIKSVLSQLKFGGFTVHAFSTVRPGEVLGRFTSPREGLKLSNCNGEDNVATYHAYPGESEVELHWQAPSDYVGEIFFNATVAHDYDTFWVGVTSSLEVVRSEAASLKSYFSSSTVLSNQIEFEQRNSDPIYEGCGTKKTCFGLPNNCVEQQSCQAIATATRNNNRYEFELKSDADDIAYVALGLSNDALMGDDSVMECIIQDDAIRLYSSYNNRRGNIRQGVPQSIITLVDSSLANGTIYCKFERDAVTTVFDIEFDLSNENYHFLLAIGSSVSHTLLTRHDLARTASIEPLQILGQLQNPVYVGCGSTKTCFGMPLNCVPLQSCEAVVTATNVNNRFRFELESSAAGVGYVALGISRDPGMGDASVMECVQEGGNIREYNSWNFRRSNTRDGVPQDVTTLLDSSFVEGTIYCKLERDASTIILEEEFDLLIERFYFMIAVGTNFTPVSISMHNLGRAASTEPLEIIRQGVDIYEGCGSTKTCFGMPLNCVPLQSCEAVVTATKVNNRFRFELQSTAAGVGYVALGISRDPGMGDASVMECVQEGGNIREYNSWNFRRSNTREGVPQDVTTLLDSSFVEGTIYCKLERDASTIILEEEFDLQIERFYFLIAIGTNFTPVSISMHNLGRAASTEPLEIIRQGVDIYEGCGTNKTCFGLPLNCVPLQTCEAVVTATNVDNRFLFELQSTAAGVGYVALGISRDPGMGDASVMECVQEGGNIREYNSWNFRRSNTRDGVPQNVTSMLDSSFVEGTIYCKLERDPATIILEEEFDLQIERFYFLIAIGTAFTPVSISMHDLGREASTEPVRIITPGVDPIYEGCGADKTCFGMPARCVEELSCETIVAVTVEDDQYYFELQSDAVNVGYVSFALSEDNLMGDDSVIECVRQNNNEIRAFTSWNTARPTLSNTRQGMSQCIISLLNSTYNDGKIYCKVRRDKSTVVRERSFDLARQDFYFLLAIGTGFTNIAILEHDLGHAASDEAFTLPGRASAPFVVRLSAIAIVAWLLATSCTHLFRGP